MEYKLAHKFLYDKAIEKGFIQLANHIKKVGPLRIKVSKMDFVSHLSKINHQEVPAKTNKIIITS